MGQGDIIDLLRKNKEGLNTKEIASKLNTATSSALVKLRKLRKQGEIIVKEKNNKYIYIINEK